MHNPRSEHVSAARIGGAPAPLQTPDAFTAYSVGICNASVCTSLNDEEATFQLNLQHWTGIGAPWRISDDSHFADGVHTNPCPCEDRPDTHRHILFHC